MSVEAIVKGLRPSEDTIDKRILYKLTGNRLDVADYRDDSSYETEEEEKEQKCQNELNVEQTAE